LRKVLAVVLAVPVVGFLYLATLAHRTLAGRVLVAVGAGAAVGLGVVALVPPRPTTATPPTVVRPMPAVAFETTLTTGVGLRAPVVIRFATPMDAASVAAALRVDPVTAVSLTWDPTGRALAVQPVERWAPGALHAVTVDAGAVDTFGQPLANPARSVFVTREPVVGTIAGTSAAGSRIALDSGFRVAFDAPVDVASAAAAFHIEPAVDGRLVPTGRRGGVTSLTFQPAAPLAADTIYRVWFDPTMIDVDGAAVMTPDALRVRTIVAPSVVRFRPKDAMTKVERSANVSVRFTTAMQRSSTAKAFRVVVNGKAVQGRITWAEGDTVLVFDPATAFPYGATVVATVDASAHSRAGAALTSAKSSFTVAPKPKPKPKPKARPKPAAPTSRPISKPPSSGGGSVGSGSWGSVERYYLNLMNCTRTGGWVTSGGRCSSPGGRNVRALKLDSGISARVSRPYAKLLATRGICNHFINGNPGDRLRRAGYDSYRWAENLGCRSGNAYSAVLGSHLYFQSERPYRGGHYVNLMNGAYDRVGIGVWVSSGRVRLVVDFYHP
jgi:uncharacterized protein YkwD